MARKPASASGGLAIEFRPVDDLTAYAHNSRKHPPSQVAQIAGLIRENGWTVPVLIRTNGEIIAGHGRVMAAEDLYASGATLRMLDGSPIPAGHIPVLVARGWSDAQIRAYVIADNKVALNAEWDEAALARELAALKAEDIDIGSLGFTERELGNLLAGELAGGGLTDKDAVPEAEKVEVSRTGDVWLLGDHRVMCGDSTLADDVETLMAGRTAVLMHADPPYGMGKAADGVANDNLYREKLDAFQMDWWRAFRPHLADNATAYIWGNAADLWRLWWRSLEGTEPLTFCNEIVWDKKDIAGMASEALTLYPTATERCLFFKLGRHVLLINQTKDDYWDGWEPIRTWLCAERDKAGWKPRDIKRICGNHMYGHWFGKSQWVFLSAENYERLQQAAEGRAFTRSYADLHREYRAIYARFTGEVRDDRVAEFEATRPYFDNAHDIMRDVWEFKRVTGEDRHGHATPKPVDMMERVMKSSARAGAIIVEPFAGSGSTLIGAERTGRICYTMEMQPAYVDVVVRRWQAYTGQDAILEGEGLTFAEIAEARG